MKKHLISIFILAKLVFANNEEYLIICPLELVPIAESLLELHSNQVDIDLQLSVRIGVAEDIYSIYNNESPQQAIRSYVINEIETNLNIRYLLLLGDENDIPPILNSNESPSDDFYSSSNIFQGNPQLSTGRIPIDNVDDGLVIIDKIQNYILNPPKGKWRSVIALISDDENKEGTFEYNELSHTKNSDKIFDELEKKLHIKQLYGPEYEPIYTQEGLAHPDMTNDILNAINSGVSLINYIGHGSASTLSDEKLLSMERDLDLICSTGSSCYTNKMIPIWEVGTCSFGEYDQTNSMTEELLKSSHGGIAIVSTTRGVGVAANINYLENFFEEISEFIDNNNSNRLGDIVRIAKGNSNNNYLFHVFGDPALPLPFPKSSTEIIDAETISGFEILTDESIELNTTELSSIQVSTNSYEISYNVNDSILSYTKPGEIIYQGSFETETCFRIPIDSQFCDTCSIELKIYTDNQSFNGNIQYIDNIPLNESDNQSLDINGPQINLMQMNNKITKGSIINKNYPLEIHLNDPSGINLMNSFQHNIRYWFNDDPSYYLANSNVFEYINGCDSGFVQTYLPSSINTGVHEMHIEAWDNANNRTINSFLLTMRTNDDAFIHDVYNFPNPMKNSTYFTFYLASYPSEIKIEIFSINGKKVKTFPYHTFNDYYNTILWNGKGDNGENLQNGAYFYHLHGKHQGSEFENVYKLAILK